MPVYVYALVERPMRQVRVRGRTLETVGAGDIFAVIERTVAARPVSESVLLTQHAIVASLARRFDAILPARFGAFIELPELERVVLRRAATLREAFELVRGREQMTVRLFGLPPRVRNTGKEPPLSGEQYLARRSARAAGADPLVTRLRDSVERLIIAERLEKGAGTLRVTVHHLVERGTGSRYRQLLGRVIAKVPATMTVRVSGPWPPFAFAPSLWS